MVEIINDSILLEEVLAKNTFSSELEYVSHMTITGTYSKATGDWIIGDLAGMKMATLTIKAKTLKAGNVINTGEVTSKTPDPNPKNNKTTVTVPVIPPVTIRTGANPSYLISIVAGTLALLAALVLFIRTRKAKN